MQPGMESARLHRHHHAQLNPPSIATEPSTSIFQPAISRHQTQGMRMLGWIKKSTPSCAAVIALCSSPWSYFLSRSGNNVSLLGCR